MIGASMFGSSLLGSTSHALDADGLQVYMGGDDVSGMLQHGSVDVRSSLRGAGTARFRLVDLPQALVDPGPGLEVTIDYLGERVFGGTVDHIELSVPVQGEDAVTFLSVECVDFSSLADRYLVAERYEAMTQGEIVRDIVASTGLVLDGITTVGVQEGIEIDIHSFDYSKVSDALNELAELTDWIWQIDSFRNLHFHDRALFQAPHNLGTLDLRFISCTSRRDRNDYANRLVVRAGKDRTSTTLEETFAGDGETQNFVLPFEVAEKPVILVDTGSGYVAVDPAVIGVRGVDKEADEDGTPTAFKWFWAAEEKDISQAGHQTALGATHKVKVQYIGLFLMVIQADNTEEQRRRQEIEGGSGIYEDVRDEPTIDGRENAITRSDGLLRQVDGIKRSVEFTTDLVGFRPGQLMDVLMQELHFWETLLVDRVSVQDIGTFRLRSRIELTSRGMGVSFFQFWRNLEKQGRKFIQRENEQLELVKKADDVIGSVDLLAVAEGNSLASWAGDQYSFFTIGFAKITGIHMRTPQSI